MWEQIANLAISNGLFAVLFLGLREQKYQMTIEKLGNSLEIVKQVKEDVEDIKDKINQKKIVFRKVKEKTNEEKA